MRHWGRGPREGQSPASELLGHAEAAAHLPAEPMMHTNRQARVGAGAGAKDSPPGLIQACCPSESAAGKKGVLGERALVEVAIEGREGEQAGAAPRSRRPPEALVALQGLLQR